MLHHWFVLDQLSIINNSPLQLAFGYEPDISHIRFGCAIQVHILLPQRTKISPQQKFRIYVGFDSPSITRYLEFLIGDLFTTHFTYCHFDEMTFLTLGREKLHPKNKVKFLKIKQFYLIWILTSINVNKRLKIIYLQNVANQLSDIFIDTRKVTNLYIPEKNISAKIDIPEG